MIDRPNLIRRRADQLRRQLPPRPTPTPPTDERDRLATLVREEGEELRVSWSSYKRHPCVAVRVWRQGPRGWRPTKSGGSVRLRELPAFADGLLRAQDRAAAHLGLASGGAAPLGQQDQRRGEGPRRCTEPLHQRGPERPPAAPATGGGERLATIDRDDGLVLVSWCLSEGRPHISVRARALGPGDWWEPSERRYTVWLHELPEFAEGIAQALDRARPRLGLPRVAARFLSVRDHPLDDGQAGADGADRGWERPVELNSSGPGFDESGP